LVKWELVYTKQARKDAKKIAASGLKPKAQELLEIIKLEPYQTPPPYKQVKTVSPALTRHQYKGFGFFQFAD